MCVGYQTAWARSLGHFRLGLGFWALVFSGLGFGPSKAGTCAELRSKCPDVVRKPDPNSPTQGAVLDLPSAVADVAVGAVSDESVSLSQAGPRLSLPGARTPPSPGQCWAVLGRWAKSAGRDLQPQHVATLGGAFPRVSEDKPWAIRILRHRGCQKGRVPLSKLPVSLHTNRTQLLRFFPDVWEVLVIWAPCIRCVP